MNWDTLTLDCYGTLVDWETGITRAFASAAAKDGVELEPAAIMAAYHEIEPRVQGVEYRRYREVLAETALGVAERLDWQLSTARAGFLADSLPDWPIFADTRAALQRLKPCLQLAILSNVDDDLLAATMQRIAVDFDWTVTAEQTRSYKPNHAHFQQTLDRMNDGGSRWLHAAQSYYHDIRPAGELGIPAVWVNRKNEERPPGPPPLQVVKNLGELADWLGV